jgi:Fic family protein
MRLTLTFIYLFLFLSLGIARANSIQCLELISGWHDSKSAHLNQKLAEEPSNKTLQILSQQWSFLKFDAERYDWNRVVSTNVKKDSPLSKAIEEINSIREQPSTTIQGTKGDALKNDETTRAHENWLRAKSLVEAWIAKGDHPTADRLHRLHKTLTEGLRNNGGTPGAFRDYEFPDWFNAFGATDVPSAIDRVFDWYNLNRQSMPPILLATNLSKKIVTIHAFSDGNGRTSRLLLDWVLGLNGLPPAAFPKNTGYLERTLNSGDIEPDLAVKRVTDGVSNTLSILHRAFR